MIKKFVTLRFSTNNSIMKKLNFLFALLFCSFAVLAQQDEFETMPYVLGDILIMVDNNDNIQEVAEKHRNINGVMTEFTLIKVVSEPANIWLFHFNQNNLSHNDMLRSLDNDPHVVICQNNHLVTERATVPNDTNYGSLWYHDDGVTDNDIDSELAWDITTGGLTANGDEIVVAVLEGGGAAWAHSDLVANHWVNTLENPTNGIDDDGNGYIDDYDGWNTTANNDNIATGGHGTGVSSMIGATGNNNSLVVGANWSVKIMQVDMSNSLTESNVIAAYTYPLKMRQMYNNSNGTTGAFVVATNASWGIDNGNPASAPLWCAFYDTLGYHGILNMGATANNNVNIDVVGDLPTGCGSDYMISVTATNNADVRTFSGYGQTTIDLGAPGQNVLMAYNTSGTSTASGTSFASPLTAGVCALMYSVPCSNLATMAISDPQGAADIVRQALLDGTDPVANLTTECVTGGRLNSYTSCLIIQTDCGSYSTNCTGTFSGSQVAVTGCAGDCNGQVNVTASGGSGFYTYDIGGGPQGTSNFTGLCAGNYTVLVDDGVECAVNVSVTVTQPAVVSGTSVGTSISCNGAGDGQININGSGGTPPYQYSIDNGATFQSSGNFTGLAGGVYNVVIQDSQGCLYNTSTGVNEPASLSLSTTVTDETNGNDGAINLTVSGGTAPFTYSWTGPNSFTYSLQDPNGLVGGTYEVTVTDANGCVVASGSVVVGSSVGISENEFSFSIYPNPAKNEVIISLANYEGVTMQIFDNAGRVVQEQVLTNENNNIKISQHAAGIYSVKLTAKTGLISTTRLVIR